MIVPRLKPSNSPLPASRQRQDQRHGDPVPTFLPFSVLTATPFSPPYFPPQPDWLALLDVKKGKI